MKKVREIKCIVNSKSNSREFILDLKNSSRTYEDISDAVQNIFTALEKRFGNKRQQKEETLEESKSVTIKPNSNQSSMKSRSGDHKLFVPFENYVKIQQEKVESTPKKASLDEKKRLRSEYAKLPNDRKLEYIKIAEMNYDSFNFSEVEDKPLFFSFLNKTEAQILFDSYGTVPKPVPKNISCYFMKKMFESGTRDLKTIYSIFRQMKKDEKKRLIKENCDLIERHSNEMKLFLERLPKSRLTDFQQMNAKKRKQTKFENSRKKVKVS